MTECTILVEPIAISTTFQVLANSIQRQVLNNLKLGVNTNETWNSLGSRFGKNPSTILSGLPHRFTLQFLTQGLPMYYNKVSKDQINEKKISDSLTALWMTVAGCVFEVSGLKQPIEDKAKALGNENIKYWQRGFQVASSITPLVLLRNNFYAKVVFGQNKDDPMSQRALTAAAAGIITNPIDNAINIVAYETAVANKSSSMIDIYRQTWNRFIVLDSIDSPYNRSIQILRNILSGSPLRVIGLVGACVIFSDQTSDVLREIFTF